MSEKLNLTRFPAHLGREGAAVVLPEFTGDMEWCEAYGRLHPNDGGEATALFITAGEGTEHRPR